MHGNASVCAGDDRPATAMHGLRTSESSSRCETCPVRAKSFCRVLIGGHAQGRALTQHHETAARRKILFEPDRLQESVYVICDGWAFRFRRFEDGRRYILNFLIAGDVVYGDFSESPGFSLQALTDIRYCQFVRAEVRPRILERPWAYDAWMAARIAERNELAATATALAQLSAAERIAQLILHLRDRVDAHEMVHNESCAFPLRQAHIADATGLTTVHVSRTISAFRKDGVLAIDDGKLTILNLAKLRQMVERK